MQCSETNINPTRAANLINVRDALGINDKWNRYQIRYLINKRNDIGKLSSNSFSAEQLINSLSLRDDTNYLYVTFEPDEGLVLIGGKNKLIT